VYLAALAMLAGRCVAPEKGSPRRWPKARWWWPSKRAQGLALALLYWNT